MGWLGRLLSRDDAMVARDGMCVLRRRELVEGLRRPTAPVFAQPESRACDGCGEAMEALLITSGGPLADPELWRDLPVSVDGWVCQACSVFQYPRTMTPERISAFMDEGASRGREGDFAAAEWWFTRVVWDWPGYAPGHLNLAEATRSRLHVEHEDPAVRRRLRERMREQYEEGCAAYEQSPSPELEAPVARALLTLAQLAIEDGAFPRASRSLEACLALPALAEPDRARAQELRRYAEERHDLFDAAAAVIDPYLQLMDRPGRSVDTPDQRSALNRAISDLERHYRLAPVEHALELGGRQSRYRGQHRNAGAM